MCCCWYYCCCCCCGCCTMSMLGTRPVCYRTTNVRRGPPEVTRLWALCFFRGTIQTRSHIETRSPRDHQSKVHNAAPNFCRLRPTSYNLTSAQVRENFISSLKSAANPLKSRIVKSEGRYPGSPRPFTGAPSRECRDFAITWLPRARQSQSILADHHRYTFFTQ